MDEHQKEVLFHYYCPLCKHRQKEEHEDPCYECLDEPARTDSHKPVCWEEP